MKTLNELAKENGTTTFEGREYVLLQQAYVDGPVDDYVYLASAVCPDDGVDEEGWTPKYEITWFPTDEFIAYANQCAEDGDWCDESDACDWDSPESVKRCGEYNSANGYSC